MFEKMARSGKRGKYNLKARAERYQETRQRIVEATLELHRTAGPARTTITEIAKKAGVERQTVYNHFPDPLSLFKACPRTTAPSIRLWTRSPGSLFRIRRSA